MPKSIPRLGAAALFSLLLPLVADAGDLKAPFELESAAVLPKGVGNPRLKNLWMGIDARYSDAGVAEPLGQKLNKRLGWGDVLDGADNDAQRAEIRGVLQAYGIDEDGGGPGATSGVVNTFATVRVPVLAYGINERLTVAVAVPIVNVDVSVDKGFLRSGIGAQFVAGAAKCDPAQTAAGTADPAACPDPAKGAEAAEKLNNGIDRKLRQLGYRPMESERIAGVGDIKAVLKYSLAKSERDELAMKTEFTLPTGRGPDADRALDVPTGDGQWDVGAGLVYDRRLTAVSRDLRWNIHGTYVAQLADRLERRLPTSATDSLSADKELMNRDLGDQISTGTALAYTLPAVGVTLGGGYGYQRQFATAFSGTTYARERYDWLEAEVPAQELHSVYASAGFSTVDWYQGGKFFYPLQANLTYSRPFAGRNATTNEVVSGELVLFF